MFVLVSLPTVHNIPPEIIGLILNSVDLGDLYQDPLQRRQRFITFRSVARLVSQTFKTVVDGQSSLWQPLFITHNTTPTRLQFLVERLGVSWICLWIAMPYVVPAILEHLQGVPLRCTRIVIQSIPSILPQALATFNSASKPLLQDISVLVWHDPHADVPLLELGPLTGSTPWTSFRLVGVVPSVWDSSAFNQLTTLTLGSVVIPTPEFCSLLRHSVQLTELTLRSIGLTAPPTPAAAIRLAQLDRLAIQGLTAHLGPLIARWELPLLSQLELDWQWCEDLGTFANTISQHLSRVRILLISGPSTYPATTQQAVRQVHALARLMPQVHTVDLQHANGPAVSAIGDRELDCFPNLRTVVRPSQTESLDWEWKILSKSLVRRGVEVEVVIADPALHDLSTNQGAGVPNIDL